MTTRAVNWNSAGTVLLIAAALGFAQTQVDLRTQSKDVDFSSFVSTRPLQTGTLIPATCQVGQMFFKSDAGAGQNLYACTAPNVWTVEAGAGGGGQNCQVQRAQPTVLSIFPVASGTAACVFGRGTTSSLITSPASVTAVSGTGVLYISVGPGGAINVGAGSATVTCSGCVATATTGFPADAQPVWTWTVTSGAFDVNGGTDFRAFLSYKPSPSGGRGISIAAGDQDTIGTDATVIPGKFSGSGAPGALASSTLGDTYLNTGTGDLYVCNNVAANCSGLGANQWVKVNANTPASYLVEAGGCNPSGAVGPWSFAAGGPTAFCPAGNDVYTGALLQFSSANTNKASFSVPVPPWWTSGTVSATLRVFPETGAGNVQMQFGTYCKKAATALGAGQTFNAPNATNTVAGPAAQQAIELTANLTMTGCSAGNTLVIQVSQPAGNTYNANEDIVDATVVFN